MKKYVLHVSIGYEWICDHVLVIQGMLKIYTQN